MSSRSKRIKGILIQLEAVTRAIEKLKGFPNDKWTDVTDEYRFEVSEHLPDNTVNIAGDYYQKVGEPHKATKIVEEGTYCEQCGTKVSLGDSHWCNSRSSHFDYKDGIHCTTSCKEMYRGISY